MEDIFVTIESFVNFGIKTLGLDPLDAVQARNEIYHELNVYPSFDIPRGKAVNDVNYFVNYFKQYLSKQKYDEITVNIKISQLFDFISPRPSVVKDTFLKLLKKDAKLATKYLYNFGKNNYYIHAQEIAKNVEWAATFKKASSLEISINVSKPEKNNKDIAKLVNAAPVANYPKCVLCLENLGFAGNAKKAPRHNIRIIPLRLNNEDWFMQYSPYGYFNEHMILVDQKHEPMQISERIFRVLFAFNHLVPHYTIASNSDLPIVGGSILNHEHFQGGNYLFPLQKAKPLFVVKNHRFKHTKIVYLDFYNSALKLTGKNEEEIINAATYIFKKWCTYSDPNVSIIAQKNRVRQNTITPILRKNQKHEYEFIMILRNNGTSTQYPDGIFHVHPEHFAIKQEGIGVIEAMGRFILPARLVRQIKEVEDVVAHNLSEKAYLKKYPDLVIFKPMITALKERHISSRAYINEVGQNILRNTAVFKRDELGQKALNKFINYLAL